MTAFWLILLVVLLALFTGALIFYFWSRQLKSERTRREEFTKQLINSQERERKRLAAELHDGMGQNLLVIKNNALMLLKNPELPDALREKITAISEISSSTLSDVRSISHNLRPAELDRFGLTEAINSAIEKVTDSVAFSLKSNVGDIDSLFDNEIEINIYRIVQESLNNVVKYSDATEAELSISKDENNLRIVLSDNGKGFDINKLSGSSGSGIRAISERVRLLNGDFDINSTPGKGTGIKIAIPITASVFRLKKNKSARLISESSEGEMKSNLPLRSKSFIGREKELLEIKAKLRETNLLTLIGSGGTGKTSLAIQAAEDLMEDFPDGVWMVELAPVFDRSLVTQTIASVFSLRESANTRIIDVLKEYLENKQLLLVIDNCEHLIEECSKIAGELLRISAKLKILATSREPLKVESEKTYRVPPLTFPAIKKIFKPKELLGFESVQLFYDRAVKSREDFRITESNAAAVALICNKLDGIPLAIELAAARVDSLRAESISERLNDRFHLLTRGSSKALPRQQTLHAMIDWSYDLLKEHEQTLLHRLSVFSGGWNIKAAEEICSGGGIESHEILDLLGSLVSKSLVVFDEDSYRYYLLETVKEYSSEKLGTSEGDDINRTKHLEHFLKIAVEAQPHFETGEQLKWQKLLEAENDNLRAALNFSLMKESLRETGLSLSVALLEFWNVRSEYSEGSKWLNEMLIGYDAENKIRAKALNAAGVMAAGLGNYDAACRDNEKALKIFRVLDDKAGISRTLRNLTYISYEQSDYAKADKLCEEVLVILRESGDKQGISWTLSSLGLQAAAQGDFIKAETNLNEALAIRRELNNKRGIGNSLFTLGHINCTLGNYEKAELLLEEALLFQKEMGDKRGIGWTLNELGLVAVARGDFHKAEDFYNNALSIRHEIGEKRGIGYSLNNLGYLFYSQGDFIKAEALLEEALRIERQTGDKHSIGNTLDSLGNVSFAVGDYEKAKRLLQEALQIHKEIKTKLNITDNFGYLARTIAALGRYKLSAKLFGAADALREQMKVPMTPIEKNRYDRAVDETQSALGEDEFAKAWSEGRALSIEQAIELGLDMARDKS